MLLRSVRRCVLSQRASPVKRMRCTRGLCSPASSDGSDRVRTLLQLCADRHYISPGESNAELFRRGWSCSYGPLGVELRRNLLQQWWHSVTGSREWVLGVNTVSSSLEGAAGVARVVESERFQQILGQSDLSREQLIQKLNRLLLTSPSVRTGLLQGRSSTSPIQTLLCLLQIWKCGVVVSVSDSWFVHRCLGAICAHSGDVE